MFHDNLLVKLVVIAQTNDEKFFNIFLNLLVQWRNCSLYDGSHQLEHFTIIHTIFNCYQVMFTFVFFYTIFFYNTFISG